MGLNFGFDDRDVFELVRQRVMGWLDRPWSFEEFLGFIDTLVKFAP